MPRGGGPPPRLPAGPSQSTGPGPLRHWARALVSNSESAASRAARWAPGIPARGPRMIRQRPPPPDSESAASSLRASEPRSRDGHRLMIMIPAESTTVQLEPETLSPARPRRPATAGPRVGLAGVEVSSLNDFYFFFWRFSHAEF